MQRAKCSIDGCEKLSLYAGMCKQHYNTTKRNKHRENRLKNNLCLACGKPNNTEHTTCSLCTRKKREYMILLKEKRIKECLCVMCGKPATIITSMSKRKRENTYCNKHYYEYMAKSTTGSAKNGPMLKELFEEQKGLCAYTKEKLILGVNASVDHFVPKVAGGGNEKENLKWVLWEVNKMKFKHSYEKFVSMCKEVVNHMSKK